MPVIVNAFVGARRAVPLLIFLVLFSTPDSFAFDHSAWDTLLKAHVQDGEVDYEAFSKNKEAIDYLNYYLDTVANLPIRAFADYSREDRLALWINAYNASVIRVILNHYPVGSIQDVADYWNAKSVRIAGMDYSFQEVRKQVFRKGFRDERATLALISGMKSSGPLRAEAYAGETLAEALRDQVNVFLTDERFNRIKPKSKKLKLSFLFRELADDFILGYGSAIQDEKFSAKEMAILSFIRVHVTDPEIRNWIDGRRYKVRYFAPDFRLNQIKTGKKKEKKV